MAGTGPARRRRRYVHSQSSDHGCDAGGDDELEHSGRQLYAHHYRRERQPHSHDDSHGRCDRPPVERDASEQTVTQGLATGYNVTITPISGFTGGVTLSVSGLPWGTAGTFTPNPERGLDTVGDDKRDHADRQLHADDHRCQRQPDPRDDGLALVVNTPPPPVGVALDSVGPGAGGVSVSKSVTTLRLDPYGHAMGSIRC